MDETTGDLRHDHPLLLLAGGGSGGHVFPALAVAAVLLDRGWRVTFFGSAHGMEGDLARRHGLPFRGFPARPWLGRGPFAKGWALSVAGLSGLRAALAARRLRPSVALSTGGYAAVPGVLGARLAGVPLALLEPNAAPGSANRHLSRLAALAFVAFPETAKALACPAQVSGVPVRREFFDVGSLPTGPCRLLVLGGSQGAVELNRLVPAALGSLGSQGITVFHQAGFGRGELVRAAYRAGGLPDSATVEVEPFIDDVAGQLARCHLVICRAGAITLAELAAAGRGAVLLPLSLAGGHQASNAAAFVASGAAISLEPERRDAASLAACLGPLLEDRQRCLAMAVAARSLARPGAAEAIADRLGVLGRAA